MSLTKQDLNEIKKIVSTEVDKLALITAKGFADVDKRFEQVDKRFEQVDKRFEQVDKRFEQVDKRFDRAEKRFADFQLHADARLDIVEGDLAEIKEIGEMQDVPGRLMVVEKALNIKR